MAGKNAKETVNTEHNVICHLVKVNNHCSYERTNNHVGPGVGSILQLIINFEFLVHGGWSLWGKWSKNSVTQSRSVTCDSGVRTRVRSCTRPEPAHGGNKCHGKHEFQTKCRHKRCKGKRPNF